MATRAELPTKREFHADSDDEATATATTSKKAKTTDEACSNDEIMADSAPTPEQEAAIPEDDTMSYSSSDDEREWAERKLAWQALLRKDLGSYQDMFPTIDLIMEYQLFLQLKGDAERASKIACEKDAHDLFSGDEMDMFWAMSSKKLWHIRRQTSADLSDYQRLAIYASEHDPFYQNYFHHSYLDIGFDTLYLKIRDEIDKCENIQWDTTLSDIYGIAEAIWEKHMPLDDQTEHLCEDLVHMANVRSKIKQEVKELVPVYVDLCNRRVVMEEHYQLAIKEIIEEKGFDCFPSCKYLVEEALQKHEGLASSRLWRRYWFLMAAIGSDQIRQAAYSESKLKDLITNHFEGPKESTGPEYFDYVKEKIRIAKELGIL